MADLTRARESALAHDAVVREFLAFKLVDDFYGVELRRIREILSPPPLTVVPRAPNDVLGVCSVRGLLVTVIDLRRRLRLEERPATRQSRILLAQGESEEVVGLFVDEVRQVVRLAEGEMEVAQSVLGGDLTEHVIGIGRPTGIRLSASGGPDANLLILLDLNSIVSA